MPLEKITILKMIGIIAGLLFFMNWACLVSNLKIKGYRVGDFLLMLIVFVCVMANAQKIKAIVKDVPDMVNLILMEPKRKVDEIRQGIQESRETVNVVGDHLKRIAQKELEENMKYTLPE